MAASARGVHALALLLLLHGPLYGKMYLRNTGIVGLFDPLGLMNETEIWEVRYDNTYPTTIWDEAMGRFRMWYGSCLSCDRLPIYALPGSAVRGGARRRGVSAASAAFGLPLVVLWLP